MRDKIYQASVSLTIECICLKEVTPDDLKKLHVLFSKTCYCFWLQSCRFYIKKHNTYVLLLLAHASVERTAKRCIALHNTWIN